MESPLSDSLDQDERALTNEYLLGAERRSTPMDRMAAAAQPTSLCSVYPAGVASRSRRGIALPSPAIRWTDADPMGPTG
jgi:hypothetical protein